MQTIEPIEAIESNNCRIDAMELYKTLYEQEQKQKIEANKLAEDNVKISRMFTSKLSRLHLPSTISTRNIVSIVSDISCLQYMIGLQPAIILAFLSTSVLAIALNKLALKNSSKEAQYVTNLFSLIALIKILYASYYNPSQTFDLFKSAGALVKAVSETSKSLYKSKRDRYNNMVTLLSNLDAMGKNRSSHKAIIEASKQISENERLFYKIMEASK